MKTTIQRLFIALLSATLASAQVVPRDPVTVDRTNRRVGTDIKIPSGKTLTIESGGTLTMASGSTGSLSIGAGSAASPSLSIAGYGGWYSPGTGRVGLAMNSSLYMEGDATASLMKFSVGAAPFSNDLAALGTTSLGWSDLHLATGAVINFANSNATITHSSGVLTVAGDLRVATGSDSASVANLGGTQTLTNKTLSAPKIANAGFIADANGNEQIVFTTTASAVNELTFANAATGALPTITASGGDASVGMSFVAKGDGEFQFHAKNENPYVARFYNDTYSSTVPGFQYFIYNNGNFAMGTPGSKNIDMFTNAFANTRLRIASTGEVIIYSTLQLPAGSAATPALNFGNATSDTDTGIYRVGADSAGLTAGGTQRLGWNTSGVYIGAGGTAISAICSASAALDFASTAAGAVADLTITVTGAAVGDVVALGVPHGSVTATATFSAWVSATNTVTVRFSPKATEDPASATFRATVIKH